MRIRRIVCWNERIAGRSAVALARAAVGAERLAKPLHGARVQLRDARLVDTDLDADLLHRRFGVVVHPDHFALARRQRGDGRANAIAHFALLERLVRRLRFRRHECRRKRCAVDVFSCGERRRRFDRVDANDRAAETGFVGSDARSEIGERRLCAELAAQLLARGFQLAALPAHPARPCVAAKRVNHRPADTTLGERLELDAAVFIEAAGSVNQSDHAVLDEITQLDRVRHRRGNTAGQ